MAETYDFLTEDEKLALDMQLALNLQEEEVEHQNNNRTVSSVGDEVHTGGYMTQLGVADMLFVHCSIEGRTVDMLVDSGASNSAISMKMVKDLGLTSHLNRSIQGQACGVGESKIEGILEDVIIQIGHVEFKLWFLVLKNLDPWLILGLEQMKRYKCLIDLDTNQLTFGGKDGVSIPFLNTVEVQDIFARRDNYYEQRRNSTGNRQQSRQRSTTTTENNNSNGGPRFFNTIFGTRR